MVPVFQTILTAPGGNCFSACIASIFEIPDVNDVPNFCYEVPAGDDWMFVASMWCIKRFGLGLLTIRVPNLPEYEKDSRYTEQFFGRSSAYVIAGIKTARGPLHAVVYKDDEMVHDPYPGGSLMVGRVVDWTIFFAVDPLRLKVQ
jgi:hypothetical protein